MSPLSVALGSIVVAWEPPSPLRRGYGMCAQKAAWAPLSEPLRRLLAQLLVLLVAAEVLLVVAEQAVVGKGE